MTVQSAGAGPPDGGRGWTGAGSDAATALPVRLARRRKLAARRPGAWNEALTAYVMLLPAAAVLLVFQYWPVAFGFYVSLYKWGVAKEQFLGLENYARLMHDSTFWYSLLTTAYYVLCTVPVELVLAMVIAAALFGQRRGAWLLRTLFFVPYITSQVAVAVVWRWIFNSNFGVANAVLGLVHLPPLRWLDEPTGVLNMLLAPTHLQLPDWAAGPSLALTGVAIVTIWFYLGLQITIFLAGLTAIPRELHDAARIDGATAWQLFWHVTVPLLSATTFFVVVVATIGAFQSFNLIYVLTGSANGEPLGTTRVTTLYIFQRFYQDLQLGYATALAFGLAALVIVLTIAQFRFLERRVTYLE